MGIIYKVTNRLTGKIYIGKTEKSLEQRKKEHFRDAKRKKYYFHYSLLQYGAENFIWEEIDNAETREELNEMEIFYIKELDSTNKEKGYNLHKGGDGGAQTLPEILKKLSDKAKARNLTGENNPNFGNHYSKEIRKKISNAKKKKVICIETGIVYESGIEAEEKTKVDNGDISKCCHGKKNTAGGYHWQFKND